VDKKGWPAGNRKNSIAFGNHMVPWLESLDRWLFYSINHGLSSGWLDTFFVWITSSSNWKWIWFAGLFYLVVFGGKRGRWCAVSLVVLAGVLDFTSHHLLKETIHRLRPFSVLPDVYQLVGSGGGSFPSNHALNNAAGAVVLTGYFPSRVWLWYTLAGLIAFSRVYCGVHWPSDVLAGFALGMAGGYGLLWITKRFWNMPDRQHKSHSGQQLQL